MNIREQQQNPASNCRYIVYVMQCFIVFKIRGSLRADASVYKRVF